MTAATIAYIKLKNSTTSLSKKFRVIMGSLKPSIVGVRSLRRTVAGTLDVSEGARWQSWNMTLKVYATDPVSSDYGTLADLKTLYLLNNPNGSPSDVITFEENYSTSGSGGDSHSVIFAGDLVPENIVPVLTGSGACFYVPIQLIEIAAVA